MASGADRPRRADARRNYELLLAAAREVFEQRGVDAPLDDIARRAGVGNATMYRHFPDRRELIIAVYADEVTALCDQGEALLTAERPGDALFDWLRAFIAHVAGKRELALAIADDRGGRRSALFDRWHAAMHSTASALLHRAQEAGTIRPDLDESDLLALAYGIALTVDAGSGGGSGGESGGGSGGESGSVERLLRLIRGGADRDPASGFTGLS